MGVNTRQDLFISWANKFHPTIKFTAEISEKEINFLDKTIFKSERFYEDSVLAVSTHFKPPKGFIKGEGLRE